MDIRCLFLGKNGAGEKRDSVDPFFASSAFDPIVPSRPNRRRLPNLNFTKLKN